MNVPLALRPLDSLQQPPGLPWLGNGPQLNPVWKRWVGYGQLQRPGTVLAMQITTTGLLPGSIVTIKERASISPALLGSDRLITW